MEERRKERIAPGLYGPWNSPEKEQDFEEENDWVEYLRRNLDHSDEHDSPFPGSWWSYARHDSSFEEDETSSREYFAKLSDDHLSDEIYESLYQDPKLDASNIEVLVRNGNVSLAGQVDSEGSRMKAMQIVESLPGVWSVHNELEVREEESRSFF